MEWFAKALARAEKWEAKLLSFEWIGRFGRNAVRVGVALVVGVAVLVSVIYAPKSHATLAMFYPASCQSEGWQNPNNAVGAPSVPDNSPANMFTSGNSAVLGDTDSEITCGHFEGDIPGGAAPKTFTLRFHWSFDSGSVVHDGQSPLPVSSGGGSISAPETVTPPIETPTPVDMPASSSSDTTTPESASVDTPPADTSPSEAPTENPTPAPAEIQTPAETPTVDVSAPAPSSETSSVLSALGALVTDALDPSGSSISEQLPVSSSDIFTVRYTIDGSNWISLGTVSGANWQNTDFTISDTSVGDWSDISKLQVGLFPVSDSGSHASVYVDAIEMQVDYRTPDTPSLPTVRVHDPSLSILTPDKNTFTLDEAPTFSIDDPELSTNDLAALVKDGKATIVEDQGGVLSEDTQPVPATVPADTSSSDQTTTPAPSSDTSVLSAPPVDPSSDISSALGAFAGGAKGNIRMHAPKKKSLLSRIFSLPILRSLLALVGDAQAPTPAAVEAVVLDSEGKQTTIAVTVQDVIVDGKTTKQVVVDKPERMFRPGKYTLEVTLHTPSANIVSDQDFTWGVLAVNVDRSVYHPGDKSYIQMGVINDQGHTVCNADLTLVIKDPAGNKRTFDTSDGSIIRDSACGPDNFIDVPDYHTTIDAGTLPGSYQMTLSATTPNGTRTIGDSYQVDADVSFDIERTGPTRIFPVDPYPMTMQITPLHDWSGTIVEKVPAEFDVSPSDKGISYDTVMTSGAEKILTWNLSLVAGKTTTIGYQFLAPRISPQFYLLGPLSLYDAGADIATATPVFTETRTWQIADDVNTCQHTAAQTTNNWSASTTWTSCGGTAPAAGDSVIIDASTTVTMDVASSSLGAITVNGSLNTATAGTSYALTGTTITIGAAGTLTANASTITLTGTGTSVLMTQNTLTTGSGFLAGTSTVLSTGASSGGLVMTNPHVSGADTFTGANKFYNLVLDGGGASTVTLAADIAVQNFLESYTTALNTSSTGNYSVTAGYLYNGLNFTLNNSTLILNGTAPYPAPPLGSLITALVTGTITASSSSTIRVTSDSDVKIFSASPTIYNLIFAPTLSGDHTYTLGTPTISGNVTSNPSTSAAPTTHTLTIGLVDIGSACFPLADATHTLFVQGDSYSTTATSWIPGTTPSTCNYKFGYLNIASGGIFAPAGVVFSVSAASGTLITNSGSFIGGTSTLTTANATTAFNAGSWTGSNALYNFFPTLAVTLTADLSVTNLSKFVNGFDTGSNYTYSTGYFINGSFTAVMNFHSSTIYLTGTGVNPGTCVRNNALFCGNGAFTTNAANFVVTSNASVTVFEGDTNGFGTSWTLTAINDLTFAPTLTADRTYTFITAGQVLATINGNFTMNPSGSANTLSATLPTTMTSNTLTLGATKTLTLTRTGGSALSSLSTSGSSFAISTGHMDIEAGATLVGNSSAITVTGTTGTLWTQNGTFTGSGTNVTVNGAATAAATFTAGSTVSFPNNITINNASFAAPLGANMAVVGTTTVTNGKLDTSTSNYSLTTGFLSIGASGTFAPQGSTVTINGTTTLGTLFSISGTVSANTSNITISGSVTTGNLLSTVNGTSGTFNAGTSLTLSGSITTGNGILTPAGTGFNANSSTITFSGTITTGNLFSTSVFVAGTSTVVVSVSDPVPGVTRATPRLSNLGNTFYILKIAAPNATVINEGSVITMNNTAGSKLWIASGVFNMDNASGITPGTAASFQIDSAGTFCFGGTVSATNSTCDSGATSGSSLTFPAFVTFTFDPASTFIFLNSTFSSGLFPTTPVFGNVIVRPVMTGAVTYSLSGNGGVTTIKGSFTITPTAASALGFTMNVAGGSTQGFLNVGGTTTLAPRGSATMTMTMSAGVIEVLNTANLVIQSGATLNQVTGFSTTATMNITGNVTIASGGALSVGGNQYLVGGSWSNSGTFTPGTSTFQFNRGTTSVFSGSGTNTFYNLSFVPSVVGTPQFSLANPAVLTMPNHGLSVGDAVVFSTSGSLPSPITAGTTYYVISAGFTSSQFEISTSLGGSAVSTLGSTAPSAIVTLSKAVDLAKEVDFTAGNTFTATNTFNVTGHGGALVKLFSTTPGSTWTLVPPVTASNTVTFADVQDSNCSSAGSTKFINATSSTNDGNNSLQTAGCWSFSVPYLNFGMTTNAVDFGNLTINTPRYATVGPLSGGSSTVPANSAAHQISVATSGTGGYNLLVQGPSLVGGLHTITPIGCTNTAPGSFTPASEEFGIRLIKISGPGSVAGGAGGSPVTACDYGGVGSGYAYNATSGTTDVIGSYAGTAITTTTYAVQYVAYALASTATSTYSTNLTFLAVGNF